MASPLPRPLQDSEADMLWAGTYFPL